MLTGTLLWATMRELKDCEQTERRARRQSRRQTRCLRIMVAYVVFHRSECYPGAMITRADDRS